jgi:hypothetical protein
MFYSFRSANLTWRDMQYLVAVTSRPIDLDDTTWFTNGAGYAPQLAHRYLSGIQLLFSVAGNVS